MATKKVTDKGESALPATTKNGEPQRGTPAAATRKKAPAPAKPKAAPSPKKPLEMTAGVSNFAPASIPTEKLQPIDQSMRWLGQMTQDCILGKMPLLVCYGPPGIGKTDAAQGVLERWSSILEADWRARGMKDPRRTILTAGSQKLFRKPYSTVQGAISHPIFHHRLYWASHVHEILLVDDATSLRRGEIQSLLQQASDAQTNGHVSYNFKQKLPDDVPAQFYFQGGIVIITNWNKKTGQGQMVNMLGEAFHDRATEIEFSWDVDVLFEYVHRKAFLEGGLRRYLTTPFDVKLPLNARGLGINPQRVKESTIESMLAEVEDWLHTHRNHLRSTPSFRTLRKVLYNRRWHEADWKLRSERSYLKPASDIARKTMGLKPAAPGATKLAAKLTK